MSSNNQPYIVVFGVSVYDIFGFTTNSYRSQDSNPGRVRVSFGGVGRNIAENMARIGINTRFISVIGDDEKGKSILQHAKRIQLNMDDSLVVEGESTPTYMAILNEHGEMESAIVDMKITDKITKEFVDSKEELIKNAEYMVMDSDNPAIVEYIVTKYQGYTKFILDPVSAAKVQHIKHLIGYFHTIKPNRHEAEVLCGFPIRNEEEVRKAGRYFREIGVKKVFISLDKEGIYYNDGEEEGLIQANEVKVVNVTGAGDSCIAGLGYGYLNGLSMKDTTKYSLAMSVLTISHEDTIHPNMCIDTVEQCMNELDWVELSY